MIRSALVTFCLFVSLQVSAADLTDLWVGYYSYSSGARVPMSMAIQSREGRFVGQMIEPQTSGEKLDIGRPAVIFGRSEGRTVLFDKSYLSDVETVTPLKLRDGAKPVQYTLELSHDGRTLSGRWSIGRLSGKAMFKRATPEAVDRLR